MRESLTNLLFYAASVRVLNWDWYVNFFKFLYSKELQDNSKPLHIFTQYSSQGFAQKLKHITNRMDIYITSVNTNNIHLSPLFKQIISDSITLEDLLKKSSRVLKRVLKRKEYLRTK